MSSFERVKSVFKTRFPPLKGRRDGRKFKQWHSTFEIVESLHGNVKLFTLPLVSHHGQLNSVWLSRKIHVGNFMLQHPSEMINALFVSGLG